MSNAMEHWRQAQRAKHRMEVARGEYEDHLWFARGCPLNRTGILGVSLLGSLKQIKRDLAKFPGEDTSS